jgi:hypothetical protein
MRRSLLMLGILAGVFGLAGRAEAQDYPWCAHLDFGADESVNCSFVSFEQCQAEFHGVGGFCMANNTYQAPLPAHPSSRAKKRAPLKPS